MSQQQGGGPSGQGAGGLRAWAGWRARAVGLASSLTLLLILTACASLAPPAAAPSELLAGRLSLRVEGQPERSFSAGFELSGNNRQGELLLSGPLGTTAARARWAGDQALLASAGSETAYPSLDALAAAALGEPIPMAALFDWLRGRPWPGAPAMARDDGQPGFDQLGWRISLLQWAEGWLEARRLAAPVVTVRVRLEPPG